MVTLSELKAPRVLGMLPADGRVARAAIGLRGRLPGLCVFGAEQKPMFDADVVARVDEAQGVVGVSWASEQGTWEWQVSPRASSEEHPATTGAHLQNDSMCTAGR